MGVARLEPRRGRGCGLDPGAWRSETRHRRGLEAGQGAQPAVRPRRDLGVCARAAWGSKCEST